MALARELKKQGVDLIDCTSAAWSRVSSNPYPAYEVDFAHQVRTQAGVPATAVGFITEPAQAELLVASGQADAVMLGRVMLRQPAGRWRPPMLSVTRFRGRCPMTVRARNGHYPGLRRQVRSLLPIPAMTAGPCAPEQPSRSRGWWGLDTVWGVSPTYPDGVLIGDQVRFRLRDQAAVASRLDPGAEVGRAGCSLSGTLQVSSRTATSSARH